MRVLFFYFFVFIFCFSIFQTQCNSQTYSWIWAKGGNGNGNDYSNSISTDSIGNSYVTGYFQTPTIIFGNDTLVGSTNYHDQIFIVKYNIAGDVIWARSAVGDDNSFGECIKSDVNGNIYVTGYFNGSGIINIDSIVLGNGNSFDQYFIAKFNTSGDVIWAKTASSNSSTNGRGVDIDAMGNVNVTGIFDSTITFDKITLTSVLGPDIFLVKYNSEGNVVWAKSAGGSGQDIVNSIFTDPIGSSIITGYFQTYPITFDTITLTNNGSSNTFITKYDSSGNAIWSKKNSIGSAYSNCISLDSMGNSYITGFFNSNNISFDSIILTNTGLGENIFIVKYNKTGDVLWAKNIGGSGLTADEGHGISTDENGNSYITGFFQNMIIFGGTPLISSGNNDIFIAKYDDTGNVLWATKAGGTKVDVSNSICLDKYGNTYITGWFFSPFLYCSNITLINSDTINDPAEIFVAKLNNATGIDEENFIENEINIFPNPSSGEFQISDDQSNISEISIYNTLGVMVYHSVKHDNSKAIKLNVPDGLYFTKIACKEGILVKKIIIQK
jgi:hypothetical protein